MPAAWARSASRRRAAPQAQHQPAIQRENGTTWCVKVGKHSTFGGARVASISILVQNLPQSSAEERRNVCQQAGEYESCPSRERTRTVCAGRRGLHAQAGEAASVLPLDPLVVEHLPRAPACPQGAAPLQAEERRTTTCCRKLFSVDVGVPGLHWRPPPGHTRVSLRPASCQYRSSNRCSSPTALGRKTFRTTALNLIPTSLTDGAASSAVAAHNYRPASGPSFRRRAFAARLVYAPAGGLPRAWFGALPAAAAPVVPVVTPTGAWRTPRGRGLDPAWRSTLGPSPPPLSIPPFSVSRGPGRRAYAVRSSNILPTFGSM